jgi:hypothetical protein
LLKTVKGFLAERNPDVFTLQDIIDHLYSKKQQSNWSKNRVTKIRQAIANVLGRNSGCVAKTEIGQQKSRRRKDLGSYSEDLINKTDLSYDISFFYIHNLSLADYIHRFISFDSSSG